MLIVYAHPNHDGHCGYILKELEKELTLKKIDYKVLDLYKLDYDPVLKQEEHYTSGNYHLAKETLEFQELLKNQRHFVFIYPTWWNGTPAILKGFFDRTLTSKFAFHFNNLGVPIGHLKGKAAVITTADGHILAEKIILGDRSLIVVVRDTLKFCGLKAKGFMIGKANKLTDKNKKKIQKKVASALDYLLD